MYIRPVHAELDVPTLHTFLETYPLGLLTTHIPGHPTIAALQTTYIPFVLDRPTSSSPTPPTTTTTSSEPSSTDSPPSLGALRGHMARANPQTKALLFALANSNSSSSSSSSSQTSTSSLSDEVLILFNAPVHSYVSPSFYVATKPRTGKVVPTWNYAAVQVYGRLRVHHSLRDEATEATGAFLSKQLDDLTDQNEQRRFRKSGEEEEEKCVGQGWKVSDAPSSYVELLKKGIVGLEIEITRIEGRFKLSQETKVADEEDWRGVVDGFNALGTGDGRVMAKMVEERGKRED